jgi:hypothetical protein
VGRCQPALKPCRLRAMRASYLLSLAVVDYRPIA